SYFFAHAFLSFLFQCYAYPRGLHSFPTRRSSDLVSKATVSVVILNETVLLSALTVARKLLDGFAGGPLATPKMDIYEPLDWNQLDRKSTRLNSSHVKISYAVFCLKKKKKTSRG